MATLGSIEVWEDAVTRSLRNRGVTTMLVSGPSAPLRAGGENYHTDFTAWAYERGHENDPWRTTPDPTWMGSPALPVERPSYHHAYDDSRTWFRTEADFPGPRTMQAAADWIRTSGPRHDRFFLMVDEFDPHEPFDTPEPYASLYNADEPGAERAIWPPYLIDALAGGLLDPARARQLRNNYGSKLTMIDHWFGRLLEAIDDAGLAGTTGVILCTDHGHYLGEHDLFGKPAAPVYGELGRIPLVIRWPGQAPREVAALTTSVDLHATIVGPVRRRRRASDARHVAPSPHRGHDDVGARPRTVRLLGSPRRGHRRPPALPPRLRGREPAVVDVVEPVVDHAGAPAARAAASPSGRPGGAPHDAGHLGARHREPFGPGDALPYWALGPPPSETLLLDTSVDPGETENRSGGRDEAELVDGLATALHAIDAPDDLLARLGVA